MTFSFPDLLREIVVGGNLVGGLPAASVELKTSPLNFTSASVDSAAIVCNASHQVTNNYKLYMLIFIFSYFASSFRAKIRTSELNNFSGFVCSLGNDCMRYLMLPRNKLFSLSPCTPPFKPMSDVGMLRP